MATLACKLEKIKNQNIVKVICEDNIEKTNLSFAKSFLRSINEKNR